MDFYNLVLPIQLDTAGDVPLDLSKDTKPYIKLRSSISVHWDQQVEVILNGNKVLKRTIRETEQKYEPTIVEEKQDRGNEMKAKGTLLMALPNKDQLKFHSYNDLKLLMEAIEKRYGGNKESKKLEIQGEVITQEDMNLKLLRSLPSKWKTRTLIWRNKEEIETITLTTTATAAQMKQITLLMEKLDVNGQRVGFDRTKVECYNCHKNGHFARECRAPRNQENKGRENNRRIVTVENPIENALVAKDRSGGCDWSYQAEEEHPTNFALMAHTSLGSSSSSDFEVDSCSKSCVKAYASSTAASPAVESFVNLSEMLENQENNKSKSDKGYHAVPPPFIGNLIPFKPDLTFMDEIVESENMNVITIVTPSNGKKVVSNHESTNVKNNGDAVEPKTVRKNSFRPSVIEDWNSDDDSKVEFIPNVQDKTVRPSTEKIKFVKSSRETVEKGNPQQMVRWWFCYFEMVFFLATKDESSRILKTFISEIENQLDHKVKVIRCDNGTEFKNSVMNQFCEIKGFKRELSVARTPQQNGVFEKRNRTLIEAARTMLVDSKLPTTFWAETVNTACYVLNRVLVIKPHTKTPYELIRRRTSLIDFMKPFGCPVTILNSKDNLGKFDGKSDEGYFVGYSVVSKAMRVFNKRTRIVEETLNIRFLENTPNVTGNGLDWLFDVDSLTISMNYVSVVAGNQTNGIAGTRDNIVIGPKDSEEDSGMKPIEVDVNGASDKDREDDQATRSEFERLLQQEKQTNSTNSFNIAGTPVSVVELSFTYNDPLRISKKRTKTKPKQQNRAQYDSFILDLAINPFPPADRSDFYHEQFADELAHIISPPEYDCFYFKNEPELGEFTMDVVGDIFPTREPRVHVPNVLPTHLTLHLDFILSNDSLFAYVVWIFLPFLAYPAAPPYLLSCGNEDTIFDPGISIYHSFMPSVSHRSGTFMKFNVYPNHLNESPMEILSSISAPMD
ncbi:ribonuclease H-like domain-containing protein [Tanacetum coccineum]|uniref:Ribonuclease H-like domain-containing protein n=1 Tax=Tanacetum coccineum TaxID=301880 RepID=A0ABQ5F286_9ASTR